MSKEAIFKGSGDVILPTGEEFNFKDLAVADLNNILKTLSGKNISIAPNFDTDWFTPELGADSKLTVEHNLGVVPSNVVLQVRVDTSDGDFDADLYNDGDVIIYPINGKDSGDALNATGVFSTITDTVINLFYHTYVGAIRDNSDGTNGYIKIKQFRILVYR